MAYQTSPVLPRVPPLRQLVDGLVVRERPAVEPKLLEIPPSLPHLGTGRDTEDLHDLVAVEIRSHPCEVLLRGQFLDAVLEVVVVGLQPGRAALVAGGAIGAHQFVQPRQQRPGVGDIPAHRGVGPPAVPVPVEPQMQVHQLRHVVDHLLGVAQCPHSLADHLGAHDLVVMKAHPAVGLVLAGGRLADVVQQRCPPQHQIGPVVLQPDRLAEHRQRMPVDILVLMVFVDGHPHRADLRQHHLAEAGLHHQIDAHDRVRAQQQLVQFGGDPLGGDAAQLRCHLQQRSQAPAARP